MLETWLAFEKEANTESRHREIERKLNKFKSSVKYEKIKQVRIKKVISRGKSLFNTVLRKWRSSIKRQAWGLFFKIPKK